MVDVAVVGGGPAGSAAAISCATRGLRVALFERDRFPRPHPGESLHPALESLCKQLGADVEIGRANFLRFLGIWHQRGRVRDFIPFGHDAKGPWLGWHAWRPDFDAILLERALHLGTDVRQLCRKIEPIIENRSVRGVFTALDAVRARYVIDATGGQRFLARALALKTEELSPRLTARFGYFRSGKDNPEPTFSSSAGAWDWTATVRPNIVSWCGLDLNGGLRKPPAELQAASLLGPLRGADVTWRIVPRCAGSSYFLAGDSACVLDPASSHGVLRAIMSGMLAGHLATGVLLDGLPPESAASTYSDWITGWFRQDAIHLRERYAAETDAPAWVANNGWGVGLSSSSANRIKPSL